jgi:hypothetical protein
MDPNLIHVDWERTFEALALIIILAFIVERALAVIFENRTFIEYLDIGGIKEFIAIAAAIAVCIGWKFDALGMILLTQTTTTPGYIVSGLVVAGGSKASIKLFHDVLRVKSSAYEMRHEIQAEKASFLAKTGATEAQTATSIRELKAATRKAETGARRARIVAATSESSIVGSAAAEAERAAESARLTLERFEREDPS